MPVVPEIGATFPSEISTAPLLHARKCFRRDVTRAVTVSFLHLSFFSPRRNNTRNRYTVAMEEGKNGGAKAP